MIEKMLKTTYGSVKDVEQWANDLATEIQGGKYQSSAAGWISCHSTTKPAPKGSFRSEEFEMMAKKNIAPLACPLVWAKESNAYDCVCLLPTCFHLTCADSHISISRSYSRTQMAMISVTEAIMTPPSLSSVSSPRSSYLTLTLRPTDQRTNCQTRI